MTSDLCVGRGSKQEYSCRFVDRQRSTAKKRVESILDFQLICHTIWYILLTVCTRYVNILYQNVSDKSIENQGLILRVFFCCELLKSDSYASMISEIMLRSICC